jgi:apolipoprotein D and lipocalin family protein
MSRKNGFLVLIACLLIPFAPLASVAEERPLEVVPYVDLGRYLGTWHEIARYPNRFQKDCVKNVTATYSLREDGDLRVVNRCLEADGTVNEASGKAWVTDRATGAKLRVRFFWPFSGSYWIIDLGQDYEYAVVGEPDRDYLWILSRTPTLPAETLNRIEKRLREQGYDPARLLRTPSEE